MRRWLAILVICVIGAEVVYEGCVAWERYRWEAAPSVEYSVGDWEAAPSVEYSVGDELPGEMGSSEQSATVD